MSHEARWGRGLGLQRLHAQRRTFLALCAGAALFRPRLTSSARAIDVAAIDRKRIVAAARKYLREPAVTITASPSPRSAGGLHDYYSEGDYWWPDPVNPGGPYVQRDGLTNPKNFTVHRHALIRLSVHVPALAAAWLLTKEQRYAQHAARHLRAWFVEPSTRMAPHLRFAQAISGRVTGRGVGIIDTIHLVEVVHAAMALEASGAVTESDLKGVRDWFRQYLEWMTTHPYGIEERDAKNNHGTCWVMQVATFAAYANRMDLVALCRERVKTELLPTQMAADGSFPLEIARTKPYGYSLFNLDAMAVACQVLSTPGDNLWTYELPDGRGMGRALAFMAPFIEDKRRWPYGTDVMYFDAWPIRHISLLFGGLALDRSDYLALWQRLDPDPREDEVVRNYIGRQPLLWVR